MASHIVSHSNFSDFSNVHNGNIYNNWTAGQGLTCRQFLHLPYEHNSQCIVPAQNDLDVTYLHDLRITDPRLDKKRILDTKDPLLRVSHSWIWVDVMPQKLHHNMYCL